MQLVTRVWMTAALGVTLVLGLSLGILLDRFALTTPETHVVSEPAEAAGGGRGREARSDRTDNRRHREPLLDRLTRELELTSVQHDSLETVLSANRERARASWRDWRGQYDAMREEFRDDIRAVLSDAQSTEFDEMLARDEERRQERRRRQSDGRRR